MRNDKRWGVAALVVLLLAWASTGHAYEQRRNTVSIGIQGGYGLMGGTDQFVFEGGGTVVDYDGFESGPTVAINVKYSVDRRGAIGISFDDLRFDRKSGLGSAVPKQLQLNNVIGRYYRYFKRRTKLSRTVFVGAGFHRPAFRVDDRENILPGEGFSANYGVGLEYFISRVATIDLTAEGYYIKPKGGTISSGQLKLGLHYYFTR